MAISISNVIHEGTDSDLSTHTHASDWTPLANRVYLVTMKAWRDTDSPANATPSGNGLSFTQIRTNLYAGSDERVTTWWAKATSPTTGKLSFAFGETIKAFRLIVDLTTGVDVNNPIVQSNFDADSSSIGGAFLASFEDPTNNAVYLVTSVFTNAPITFDVANGLDGGTSQQGRLGRAWAVGEDTVPSFDLPSSEDWGTIAFELRAGSQTASPSSIGSLEAFGTASVRRNITPSGIGSAEAFGTPKLNRNIKPTGIASAEAIGALGVIADVIYPTSITSEEAFGTASVQYPQTVSPSSIATAEALGTPAVRALVSPLSIESEERFGLAVVSKAPILTTGAIYVEVYDRYGNLLGEGPIADIARASTIERLDRLGEFSFEFPATDPRAALLDHGREIRIYREGEGEIFRGIVESLETVEDE